MFTRARNRLTDGPHRRYALAATQAEWGRRGAVVHRQATFTGQTAIITGGASGIGRALGRALLARGSHVVLADIDGPAASAAADTARAQIDHATGSVVGAHLDVRDRDAVQALVGATVTEHGRLDFMFNNAGISMGGETHLMPTPYWDRIVEVNLGGVINGVVAAYPFMIAQGHGHIINTASGAGLAGPPLTVAYSTTKHAVVGLSTTLRPEAHLHGVRVSVLCPGPVDTPILDSAPPGDLPPPADGTLSGRQFLARLRLSPMDADRFADGALRGVARNQPIIVVPGRAKGLWYLQRLSPTLVARVSQVMARRILAGLPDADSPPPPTT